jgi:hypothetical protein
LADDEKSEGDKSPNSDDLDSIIREIIGAERKIYFETRHSTSARNRVVREIIERRALGAESK